MSAAILVAIPGSYRIAAYARAAKNLGLTPVVVTQATAAAVPPGITGIGVDFSDYPACEARIRDATRDTVVSAIIGLDDGTVELAARLALAFGVQHNAPEAANLSSDKRLSRQRLTEKGLPVPRYSVIPVSLQDLTTASPETVSTRRFELPGPPPWVVKPIDLSASRGVIRVDDIGALNETVDRVRDIAHSLGASGTLLIEQYIEGREIAVDAMINEQGLQILAIFDKPEALQGPFFEESIYVTPSTMSLVLQQRVHETLLAGCQALGIEAGPVHAEFRIDKSELWIIEIATRTIGGDCGDIFEMILPKPIEELVLLNAMGQRTIVSFDCAAGVCMLPVREAGILRRVSGIEAASELPGIRAINIGIRDGYEMIPWPTGCSYPGFVFATAETAEEVVSTLQQASRLIQFVVGPMFPVSVTRQ